MNSCGVPAGNRELSLTRLIRAPRERLWRAWTEPELMKQWFTPRPWRTPVIEVDLRPGGSSYILMRGPNGEENPCHGVYLDVVKNERLVTTDASTRTWELAERPMMPLVLTFADEGGGTRYTARALHWTVTAREQHESMGFHEGWGKATDQLEALVTRM